MLIKQTTASLLRYLSCKRGGPKTVAPSLLKGVGNEGFPQAASKVDAKSREIVLRVIPDTGELIFWSVLIIRLHRISGGAGWFVGRRVE